MNKLSFFAVASALVLASCVTEKEKAPVLPEAKIDKLVPDKVMEGQPFQPQPNGASALSVLGSNLVKGSRIKVNGMPLETASGDGTSLAALVPSEMFAKAGSYAVGVETPDGRATNTLTWTVLPKTGPAPEIKSLHPDATKAGKGFNVQPNGVSAMGVVGANFLPGAKLLIDGKVMETSFGNTDQLGAIVTPGAYAKAGKYKVTIQNPDGKVSAPKEFAVSN
jgi:hypothetical protein